LTFQSSIRRGFKRYRPRHGLQKGRPLHFKGFQLCSEDALIPAQHSTDAQRGFAAA
jgi:hypothetical protein